MPRWERTNTAKVCARDRHHQAIHTLTIFFLSTANKQSTKGDTCIHRQQPDETTKPRQGNEQFNRSNPTLIAMLQPARSATSGGRQQQSNTTTLDYWTKIQKSNIRLDAKTKNPDKHGLQCTDGGSTPPYLQRSVPASCNQKTGKKISVSNCNENNKRNSWRNFSLKCIFDR